MKKSKFCRATVAILKSLLVALCGEQAVAISSATATVLSNPIAVMPAPIAPVSIGRHDWQSKLNCPNIPIYAPKSANAVPASGGPYLIVGNGHNWQPHQCSDFKAVISTQNFNSSPKLIKHNNDYFVEVGSAVSIQNLLQFLEKNGRTLETFPNQPTITIGGAVATASHGTSFVQGTISDSVVGVTIAPKILPTVNLQAYATSVGKLGVVTKLKLRTVPAITLTRQIDTISVKDCFANWNNLIKDNARMQAWLDVETQTVLLFRYNPPGQKFAPVNTVPISIALAPLKVAYQHQKPTGSLSAVMLGSALTPRLEAEYGVNLQQGSHAILGLENFLQKNNISLLRPLLIRFGGYDSLPWLTTANSPGGTVFINVDLEPGHEAQLQQIERYMVYRFNARFHLGKFHTSGKILRKAYGQDLQKFNLYQGKQLKKLYGTL